MGSAAASLDIGPCTNRIFKQTSRVRSNPRQRLSALFLRILLLQQPDLTPQSHLSPLSDPKPQRRRDELEPVLLMQSMLGVYNLEFEMP